MDAAVEERIVLGDSIGPDEYRMWKKESGEMFDKEILRSYIKENGGIEEVKNIPPVIVEKMSQKYQESYQLFTK
jgi:phosphoribosylaminoimidazole-succinocarboxamide synthase